MTLSKWMRQADVDDAPGREPAPASPRSCGMPVVESSCGAGKRSPAPGRGLFIAVQPAGKRLYPLVSELAADGIPVAVTCRVLKVARQPYTGGCPPRSPTPRSSRPTGQRAVRRTRRYPEFGYRFLVEEARTAGEAMAERTAWRICSQHRLWSVFGKKRGKNGKVGPPVHDDLVERDFPAEAPISCGWPTLPNTRPARASSTSARSANSLIRGITEPILHPWGVSA